MKVLVLIGWLLAYSVGLATEVQILEGNRINGLIDWASVVPQLQSLLQRERRGGRIRNVAPITFAVCYRDGRVIETLTVLIQHANRPIPSVLGAGEDSTVIGFFFRAPYEFNGEWESCRGQIHDDSKQGEGWASPDEFLKKAGVFAAKLRTSSFGAPLWPERGIVQPQSNWLRCLVFIEGLKLVTPDVTHEKDLLMAKDETNEIENTNKRKSR